MSKNGRRVKSVGRTCELIALLSEKEAGTISELAAESDLSPGSVHTHLTTLREYGLIQKRDNEYRLGLELLPLGEHVRIHTALYRAAEGQARYLAQESGGAGHIVIEHEGKLLIIDEVFGNEAVGKQFHVRKREKPRRQMHCTAAGKAILARIPESRIREIVDRHGMPRQTANTITDYDELVDDLETVREQGFALNNQEQLKGIRAVATAVLDDSDEVLGSVSVSGPANGWGENRFTEQLPKLTMRVANAIEANIHSEHPFS